MKIQWILLGAGGHGRVLLATLHALGWKNRLVGVLDPGPLSPEFQAWRVPHLGDDDVLEGDGLMPAASPQTHHMLNGVGSVAHTTRRKALYQKFRAQGYTFARVSHPTAWVADSSTLADGVQVMAGAMIQTGCRLGENVLVNTRAVVEHDCLIGEHVHLASGVVLCGNVQIGAETHVGAGATVIQGIRIGANVCIGAGSVVLRDIPDGAKVVGVPARELCT